MKNERYHAREIALQILYRYDVALQSKGTPIPEGADLLNEVVRHFDHFKVPEDLREFASLLVAGTLQKLTDLDLLLEKQVSNWRVTRLGYVDRSLLRMAAYELQYVKETPATVVIDEAIELAKQFGTEDTPAFINGVLDALRKSLPLPA